MKVTIIERPPVHVAYLRHTGPYGQESAASGWKPSPPGCRTNNLIGRERFGIALDDPTVTAPAKCRYDACVQMRRKGNAERRSRAQDDSRRQICRVGVRRNQRRNRRGLGSVVARLAAEERTAARLTAVLRTLPGRTGATTRRPGSFTCNICVPVCGALSGAGPKTGKTRRLRCESFPGFPARHWSTAALREARAFRSAAWSARVPCRRP